MIHLRLTIDIDFDETGEGEAENNTATVRELAENLNQISKHVADEGLMSGDSVAIVTDWKSKVEQIGEDETPTSIEI